MTPAVLIAALIALVSMVFSLQNAQKVQVTFLAWFFEGPLVVVLLVTFLAGASAAWLFTLPTRLRLRRELETHRRHDEEEKHHGGAPPREGL
ncbi:lipopolysaccharide assembly LapA domain-containing protein [Geobacter sp.]|uniref:LapA family protein n=1 Tax=Geobacter sp. TaxID=46610 RepID=UPI0026230760|nr:LapA family protein [Geobacter sp.]